jgi:hypothetical protein
MVRSASGVTKTETMAGRQRIHWRDRKPHIGAGKGIGKNRAQSIIADFADKSAGHAKRSDTGD